jgi:hypothetical protein
MMWVSIWTPCSNFYYLHYIPLCETLRNIIIGNNNLLWILQFKVDLVVKEIHPTSTHFYFFMVQILVVLCPISYSSCSKVMRLWGSSFSSFKPFEFVPFVWFHLFFIVFLFFHIPINSFINLLVHLVIWWHFMLLVVQTLTSWSTIQGRPLYLNIVYALCLFLAKFFTYIQWHLIWF